MVSANRTDETHFQIQDEEMTTAVLLPFEGTRDVYLHAALFRLASIKLRYRQIKIDQSAVKVKLILKIIFIVEICSKSQPNESYSEPWFPFYIREADPRQSSD